MVRVRRSINQIVKAREEGAKRAFAEGKPSHLTIDQRKKWIDAHGEK